jgi:hypothetical protein
MSVHCTFICHLLHVSADFGHHQVDFTTYKKKDSILRLSYLTFYKQKESFENSIENFVKKLFYSVRD